MPKKLIYVVRADMYRMRMLDQPLVLVFDKPTIGAAVSDFLEEHGFNVDYDDYFIETNIKSKELEATMDDLVEEKGAWRRHLRTY